MTASVDQALRVIYDACDLAILRIRPVPSGDGYVIARFDEVSGEMAAPLEGVAPWPPMAVDGIEYWVATIRTNAALNILDGVPTGMTRLGLRMKCEMIIKMRMTREDKEE